MESSRTSLLQHAQSLCTYNLDDPSIFGDILRDPVWLSPHLLLAHSNFPDGSFHSPYQFDIRTRHATPLPQLGKHIHDARGSVWQFSTDKQWLLYYRNWPHRHTIVAVSREGKSVPTWEIAQPHGVCQRFWLPGTHRWMHLRSTKDSPEVLQVASLYELGRKAPVWERRLPPLPSHTFIGYTSPRAVLLADYGSAARISLRTLNLSDLSSSSIPIAVPESLQIDYRPLVSPDGRQIAFVGDNALWTVGCDRRGLRNWGKVSQSDTSLALVGWQPGTNSLTFQYKIWNQQKGYLYRLPAL